MTEHKEPTSSEAAIGAPAPTPEQPKPRRSANRRNTPKNEVAAAPNGENMYEITLHDSKEIPPNGQFVGVNGRQFLLKPGRRMKVPASVLAVLDNAVQSVPEINEKLQVVGMRQAPRLTYTLHRE